VGLRTNGTVPVLPLYALIAYTGTTLALSVLEESMHRIGPPNYIVINYELIPASPAI
jgi:hypothetical protein